MAGCFLQCIKYSAHKIEALLTLPLRHVWCQTDRPYRDVEFGSFVRASDRRVHCFLGKIPSFLVPATATSALSPTCNDRKDCRGMGMSLLFGDLVGKVMIRLLGDSLKLVAIEENQADRQNGGDGGG